MGHVDFVLECYTKFENKSLGYERASKRQERHAPMNGMTEWANRLTGKAREKFMARFRPRSVPRADDQHNG